MTQVIHYLKIMYRLRKMGVLPKELQEDFKTLIKQGFKALFQKENQPYKLQFFQKLLALQTSILQKVIKKLMYYY